MKFTLAQVDMILEALKNFEVAPEWDLEKARLVSMLTDEEQHLESVIKASLAVVPDPLPETVTIDTTDMVPHGSKMEVSHPTREEINVGLKLQDSPLAGPGAAYKRGLIHAIKMYRTRTGATLVIAKLAIEKVCGKDYRNEYES